MSAGDARIQPLPSDAVAKLKSSTSITHLNGVILELAKNSLDANARTIIVTVDFPRGSCVVEDDGDGIPPAEFQPGGGLGKAHHTSKFRSEEDVYGQKGLFLVSLAALSLLSITSHHSRHQTTNSVIFHRLKPVARLVPAPIQQELRFTNHGARVAVNDLFGNMPVRVKSRALAFQRQEELEKEWDDLRHLLASIMLANNRLNKLVISDTGKSRKITVRLPVELSLVRDSSSIWDESDLKRIRLILVQAGFINFEHSDSWNTVSACLPDLSIHAAISFTPSPTKKTQFISLGMNPVFARNNTNVLYSEINRLFALSDFGTAHTGSFFSTENASSVEHAEGQRGTHLKGTSKAINRWPMFYIRINTTVPQGMSDDSHEVAPESDKSVQRIIDVLSAMINEFLAQHSLRPRAVKRKRKTNELSREVGAGDRHVRRARIAAREDSSLGLDRINSVSGAEDFGRRLKLPSFQSFPRASLGQDIGSWSRIKSAKESTSNARFSELPRANCNPKVMDASYKRPDTRTERERVESPTPDPASLSVNSLNRGARSAEMQGLSNDLTDTMIRWTDPCTKQTVFVNSRTGQTMNLRTPVSANIIRPQSTGSMQAVRRFDDIRRPKSAVPKTGNIWIENMLRKWDNPAFSRSERPISSTNLETKCENAYGRSSLGGHDCSGDLFGLEAGRFSKSRGKLWRRGLETAEVVAQVDQKFILVKMQAAPTFENNSSDQSPDERPGTVLVLIDQHAADERCRIEGLFESFFTEENQAGRSGLGTVTLVHSATVDSIYFEVEPTEMVLFERYSEFFKSWGISYAVEQKQCSETDAKTGLICVYSLPSLIAERCRTEQNLVVDLIRGEIWRKEESGESAPPRPPPRREDPTVDDTSRVPWIERIHGCPQGIIDLLNSRACRSAIMFNDVLSVEECGRLVRGLARCTFPFQCAHGRPSMIPILDLVGTVGGIGAAEGDERDEGDRDDFEKAFREWRGNWN